MPSRTSFLRKALSAAAGAGAVAYAAYRKDLEAARARLDAQRQVVDSPAGPIEFAESGDGPPVLVIHGAGGGFDQGLDLAAGFLGDGYRAIAPSRFGYLGSPIPEDASPEAQADVYAQLLDALHLETVPVIGVSAGAPSAMQFCLRHPERCSALVLVVPMAWAPDRDDTRRLSPLFVTALEKMASSDLLFWTATRVARPALVKTILGTPVSVYRNAPARERRNLRQTLRGILPISARAAGIRHDGEVASSLRRYDLERIGVPALVISAADDLYDTYESAFHTAEQIPGARFLGFPGGGHLLLGHEASVRTEIRTHLGALQGRPIDGTDRASFFSHFSKLHEGAAVTVRVNARDEVVAQPFRGLSVDRGDVIVSTGDQGPDRHHAHRVLHVKDVRLLETRENADSAITLTSDDGTRTEVRFLSPMRADLLEAAVE
jgi:2-hydroxy-6-oxonona-2,4-dienedioate hydrolase